MTAEELLSLTDCGLLQEEIAFHGKRLIVRELTCEQRDKFDRAWLRSESLRVALILSCVFDAETDELFFKGEGVAKRLAKTNSKFIEPLAEVCLRVNGFYETVETQKKK